MQMFSEGALEEMERGADAVDGKARAGKLPAECWHTTLGRGGLPKRTKFFFGARYLWTRDQLACAAASRARGIRADVPPPPSWIQARPNGCSLLKIFHVPVSLAELALNFTLH